MNKFSGYAGMIISTVIWGNLVLVFAHIDYIPALEVISHRVVWGLIVLLLWLGFRGRLAEIVAVFHDPKLLGWLALAAILVASNWLGFVWSVANRHGLEAGLGYFIFPIFTIALGAIFNRERLDRLAWFAILLAVLAVAILTYGLGRLPWISIFLAASFSLYALIKSRLGIGAVISVTIEYIFLFPFGMIWLGFAAQYGLNFGGDADSAFWLIFTGVLTAISLIGFGMATRSIGMVASGMLFFINPTLQVINAGLVLGEPLTQWHQMAFPLIALACVIYCYDLWRNRGRE